MTVKSNWKNKLPQLIVSINALLSVFICSMEFSWQSPFIPKLLSKEFPLHVTLEDTSLFTTTHLVGTTIGCLTCTLFVDCIGRKYSLLLVAPMYIAEFILLYFTTKSLIFLHVGRFLGGLIQPHVVTVVAIYIGEISEPKIRGFLLCLIAASWNVGIVFINLVGAFCTIQTTSLIMVVFPVFFIITFSLMPKSPYYLLMKNNVEDARQSLITLRASGNVEVELTQLEQDVKRQMSEEGAFKDLFLIQSNRKAFIIGSALYFLELFSGHNALTRFAQSFFSEATTVLPKEWAASSIALLQIGFVFIATFLVDRAGRRPLILASIGGTAFTTLLLSLYFIVKDFYWSSINNYSWISLLVIIMYNLFFNIGLAALIPCIRAELFPLKIKKAGNAATSVVFAICLFTSTKLYQFLADYYSIAWPLLIFALAEMGGFVFCWFQLPETKNKTLEEIQQQLKQNV